MNSKTKHLTKKMLKNDYNELKSLRKVAKKHNLHHKTMSALFTSLGITFAPKRSCTKNENIFSEETETAFYLAGFIAADGNIFHHNKYYHLHIYLSQKDEDHLLKLQKLLGSNSKIRTITQNKIIDGREVFSIIKGFTVCSKQIYYDLINNFNVVENKSLKLKFPKHLSNHPMIHHFIRGYFDGDGSFSIRNPNKKNKQKIINIVFSILGTKSFLKELRNILMQQVGLNQNSIEKRKKIYNLRYSGNYLSSLIGDWIYKDATIYLDRKYDRYLLSKSLCR